jgi:hypothetical protein
MFVRFATLCDHNVNIAGCVPCRARSEEYTAWPRCRECGGEFCPAHQQPGSKTDADLDTPETCLCLLCEEDQ